jgi:opacity protein-like surface antigen
MSRYRVLHVMALITGLSASAAFAQGAGGAQTPPAPQAGVTVDGGGVPYRRWDITLAAGLHIDNESRADDDREVFAYDDDYWQAGLGVQADVGRYWTSHLKTELSFAYLTGHETYGSDIVPVPNGVGQAFYQTDVARKYFGAAVTYQFLDNVFAHPYVSAGVRTSIFDRHKVRNPSAWVSDRFLSREYPIPPLDTRDRDVQTRPYVAAGFKSYFDERTFIRSELSTAFSDRGPVHWALRLGFGIDF